MSEINKNDSALGQGIADDDGYKSRAADERKRNIYEWRLQDDETLLASAEGKLINNDTQSKIFSVGAFLFGVLFTAFYSLAGVWFMLFGLPFLLIGLYMIKDAWFGSKKIKAAVTDKRLIFKSNNYIADVPLTEYVRVTVKPLNKAEKAHISFRGLKNDKMNVLIWEVINNGITKVSVKEAEELSEAVNRQLMLSGQVITDVSAVDMTEEYGLSDAQDDGLYYEQNTTGVYGNYMSENERLIGVVEGSLTELSGIDKRMQHSRTVGITGIICSGVFMWLFSLISAAGVLFGIPVLAISVIKLIESNNINKKVEVAVTNKKLIFKAYKCMEAVPLTTEMKAEVIPRLDTDKANIYIKKLEFVSSDIIFRDIALNGICDVPVYEAERIVGVINSICASAE
ncbi:MAG: hypothetical protein IJ446_08240 [Oscillospiraceae bacterium]|nr:hypothetical protein [Oscillospiraceae bacterium]